MACSEDQGVGQAGRCVSPRPDGGSAGVGSTNAAEMQAACADPQVEATSVPAGDATVVAVAEDGEIGADGIGAQQPAGGVYQYHHGDASE